MIVAILSFLCCVQLVCANLYVQSNFDEKKHCDHGELMPDICNDLTVFYRQILFEDNAKQTSDTFVLNDLLTKRCENLIQNVFNKTEHCFEDKFGTKEFLLHKNLMCMQSKATCMPQLQKIHEYCFGETIKMSSLELYILLLLMLLPIAFAVATAIEDGKRRNRKRR